MNNLPRPARFKKFVTRSLYLSMRDGVKIAVTVYMPEASGKQGPFPTLFHLTRYWRATQLRVPFSWFSDGLLGPEGKMIRELILRGYAFVSVDARGSGASFGSRNTPWSEAEIRDGLEVLDWVVSQSWSDGSVGLVGISYSGTAAEFLAARAPKSVKAAALLFCLHDVYPDIAFPGGIPFRWFIERWAASNKTLDQNKLPEKYWYLRPLVRGVLPASGEPQDLREAVGEHHHNADILLQLENIRYRDDPSFPDSPEGLDDFSPHSQIDKLKASGIPIYCYSGWMDGAYSRSATQRFHALGQGSHRLMLGPWEHRGRFNISSGTKVRYDHFSELLSFFDCHLLGESEESEPTPPVSYYLMGAETWKNSESWPPRETVRSLYLGSGGVLNDEKTNERIRILLPGRFGSGKQTRWESMLSELKNPRPYSDLQQRVGQLECFDSAVLEESWEVTGHPLIRLAIKSEVSDFAIFAYLLDLSPEGQIRYVTEGMLSLQHRNCTFDPEADLFPKRSFSRDTANPLNSDTAETILLDLYPIAYQFKKGHRIRLALSAGDVDHFEARGPEQVSLTLINETKMECRLDLPLVKD